MGNGFGMIPVGGSYLVQSVPAELNMDHTVVLQLAEVISVENNNLQYKIVLIFADLHKKNTIFAEKGLCNSKRDQGQLEVGERTGLPCTCKYPENRHYIFG